MIKHAHNMTITKNIRLFLINPCKFATLKAHIP